MTTIGQYAAVVVLAWIQHVLLVLFPGPLFPYQLTYKNFTVHMRAEVPREICPILDRVESLLSTSKLNDNGLHHHIYLVNSFALSRFLLLRNVHFGCNLATGQTYITNADVVENIARCERISPDDRRIRSLSEAITHEITHALIRNHVGWVSERRLPAWITEGYCEFVSEGSAIDPWLGVTLLKGTAPAFTPGLNNFRYRVMVEYLIHDRHMTIEEMIRRPPDYRQTETEVVATLRAEEGTFLKSLGSRIGSERPAGGKEDDSTPGL